MSYQDRSIDSSKFYTFSGSDDGSDIIAEKEIRLTSDLELRRFAVNVTYNDSSDESVFTLMVDGKDTAMTITVAPREIGWLTNESTSIAVLKGDSFCFRSDVTNGTVRICCATIELND